MQNEKLVNNNKMMSYNYEQVKTDLLDREGEINGFKQEINFNKTEIVELREKLLTIQERNEVLDK